MAGDNRFSIAVTAVDQASPIFDKVKAGLGSINKPIGDVQQGFRRLADSPSLENISKSLSGIGTSAKDAIGWVGELLPSVATLAGLGSLARIAAFANEWSGNAAALNRASQAIGDTLLDLQLLEGANRRVGGATGQATTALKGFGAALQDAVTNRRPEVWALLQQMHIGLKRNESGAIDTTQALLDVADAYQRTLKVNGPAAANNLAQAFGLGDLTPLLRNGSAGLRELMDETKRAGNVLSPEAATKATEFQRSLINAQDAVGGLANDIGETLIPSLQSGLDYFTKYAQAYRAGGSFGSALLNKSDFWSAMLSRINPFALDRMPAGFGDIAIPGALDQPAPSKPPASTSASVATPYSGAPGGASDTLRQLGYGRAAFLLEQRDGVSPEAVQGKVAVEINVRGAPPGTVAGVQQSGQVNATARVETSMAGYGP